jgi:WD40 repeat protein
MEQSATSRMALLRLVAAYKLRLAERAERLGAREETWGRNETISLEDQRRLLAGEGRYRVSPYPYPGLRSFDPQEGENFFGRERNVADVQARLVDARMVVVLGGSGSGKSSLLRAGLLPYLNTKLRIPGREGRWYMAEFRPRTDPLSELIDALVDQWLLPLRELRRPALDERMGVPQGASDQEARPYLINQMRGYFFDDEKAKPREAILAALLDLVGKQLDEYDSLASRGLRVPGPSLMLLLDQFEEVFRPEVRPDRRELLLNLIVDLHRHLSRQVEKGGLFLAVTMRSEELHRCAEHRGLSGVINRSFYLLDLLDPRDPEDRPDLHRAIVQPARNVFDDWGLEYDKSCADAPFAKDMPDWLLKGAKRSSQEVEHRPDQLPLLQHALQAAWHGAMRRWSANGFTGDRLTIERADLPGQKDGDIEAPDLGSCLRARADKAAERAAGRFAAIGQTSLQEGEKALQAAFRALARRDDRGTWARRFAEPEDMQAFMAADHALEIAQTNQSVAWQALRQALHVFLLRGYLSGDAGRPYDISHEALIRNWRQFEEWLREPEEVASALNRVIDDVDPKKFDEVNDLEKMQCVPPDVARKVAAVGELGQLPKKWAEDQIAPALARPAMQERWGGNKKEALSKVVTITAAANDLRRQAELAERQKEFQEKQRELELQQARALAKEQEKQRVLELEQARALAREQEKQRVLELEQARALAKEQKKRLIAASLFALVAAGLAVFAMYQSHIAWLNAQAARINAREATVQSQLKELSSIEVTSKSILRNDVAIWQAQGSQIERDIRNQRTHGGDEVTKNNQKRLKDAIGTRDIFLRKYGRLMEQRDDIIGKINKENERRWRDDISASEREDIVTKIVQFLSSPNSLNSLNYPDFTNPPTFDAQSTLRIALYALAAVPEQNRRLNDALGAAINNYRQLNFFSPPAALQVWGLAFDPKSKNELRAAVGDDNGVVWLWNPSDPSAADPSASHKLTNYTAAPGVVNGLAFSTEKNWLAAAYRDKGSVVWDLDTGTPLCVPGRSGDGGGAFGVAFHGTTLAVATNDQAVHLWDVSKEKCNERATPFRVSDVAYGVAFDSVGKRVATASGDGTVAIWKIAAPDAPYREFSTDSKSPVFAVAFSPDGKTLAATAADGRGYLWDIDTRNKTVLPARGGTVGQVAFSQDGQYVVATARPDGTAVVTNVHTRDEQYFAGGGQGLFGVAFSPDSKYLLTGDLNGVVGLWSMVLPERRPRSRNVLIELSVQRLSDMALNDYECRILRQMGIPIFVAADKDSSVICQLPFLWQRAGSSDQRHDRWF